MLDKMLKAILDRIDTYATAAIEQRAKIERERSGDEARPHAGREFQNAEGYTTPLPRAFANAQNAYARARRAFEENGGVEALSLAVAMAIARERRDEAKFALAKHEAEEASRQRDGVHRDIKPFFAEMFAHGVEPRHLANVRPELTAIICDLLRWSGHDPEMRDEASPLQAVFAIYACRQLLEPGQQGDRSRSVLGMPVQPVGYSDPRHIRFDLLVEDNKPTGNGADHGDLAPSDEVQPVQSGLCMNRDIAPGSDDSGIADPVEGPPHVGHGCATPAEPVSTGDDEEDEYGLPRWINAESVQRLRVAAEIFVDRESSWEFFLDSAVQFSNGLSDQEFIDRVAAAPDRSGSTPLRHFVETARRDGVPAGREAYRAATVRRVMHEIATSPAFEQARQNLGLS